VHPAYPQQQLLLLLRRLLLRLAWETMAKLQLA
jgi:hypothetical protein